jgi:hypothetical protein
VAAELISVLRDDLDRFVFLPGGSDERQFLTGDHDEPPKEKPTATDQPAH